jgi:hypothetical protein
LLSGPCAEALGYKAGMLDPDNPGAEVISDSPDEIFRKYGVMEENSSISPISLFNTFMTQTKSDSITLYNEIFEEVKAICGDIKLEGPVMEENKEQVRIENKDEERKEAEKQENKKRSCVNIFAEYLCEMASKVSEKFFMTLIIFARLYKDYMDTHGWEIIAKYKPVTDEEKKKAYTICNDAEHVPEACNDFTKSFLPKEYPNFDQGVSVDVTFHLCEWLFRKEYTHTHITFM